jgi:hypothetical protein
MTFSTDKTTEPSLSDRSSVQRRFVENRWLVVAAAFFALLLIGEAALFMHAVRTIPDFLVNYNAVP